MANAKKEELQEERDQKFEGALELLVAQCGGDLKKASDAQREQFSDALATWVLTSDDSAAS